MKKRDRTNIKSQNLNLTKEHKTHNLNSTKKLNKIPKTLSKLKDITRFIKSNIDNKKCSLKDNNNLDNKLIIRMIKGDSKVIISRIKGVIKAKVLIIIRTREHIKVFPWIIKVFNQEKTSFQCKIKISGCNNLLNLWLYS